MEKTQNRKEYMREYQNKKYKQEPTKSRMIRNSNRIKQFNKDIDHELQQKYSHYLSHIIKITKLYNELSNDVKDELIKNIDNYNFENVKIRI